MAERSRSAREPVEAKDAPPTISRTPSTSKQTVEADKAMPRSEPAAPKTREAEAPKVPTRSEPSKDLDAREKDLSAKESTRDTRQAAKDERDVDPDALDVATTAAIVQPSDAPITAQHTAGFAHTAQPESLSMTTRVASDDPSRLLDTATTPLDARATVANIGSTGTATASQPSLSSADIADISNPGALYLDPVGAFEQLTDERADRAADVAEARDDFYKALAKVEDVAERYEKAIKSDDPVDAMLARAELSSLQNQVQAARSVLEHQQGALADAEAGLDAFALNYPGVVEEATGLTAAQRLDLAEHNDLQDEVTQLQAELALLSDPAIAQELQQQKAQWSGEAEEASQRVDLAKAQVTFADTAFDASLISAVGAAAGALANPLTYKGPTLTPAEAETFAQLVADPTVDPLTTFTFLATSNILPEDHPAMVQLLDAHQTRADAVVARDDAVERHQHAVESLAHIDIAVALRNQQRASIESELDEAEFNLQRFESENPQLGEWIDTDLEEAQQTLDTAQRHLIALEEARIAHLERSLGQLEALADQVDEGNTASQTGALTLILGSAEAADSFDHQLDVAESNVDAAAAELADLTTPPESATEGEASFVVGQAEVEGAALNLAFGEGAARAGHGVREIADEEELDAAALDVEPIAFADTKANVILTPLQPSATAAEPIPNVALASEPELLTVELQAQPLLDDGSDRGTQDSADDEQARDAGEFDTRTFDFGD